MSTEEKDAARTRVVPALREAFADSSSRGPTTCMFIDQVGSTAMKATLPEVAWLPQLGYMYDVVTSVALRRAPGVHMKFLGDGVLLSYDGDDSALTAIETAIEIQETISSASAPKEGAMGSINFNVSIGIASGSAHRFMAPNGTVDHVGITVDKAARLCGAASPKAIFIDRATATATNFLRVRSSMGDVFNRSADEYTGERQTAALKGIPQPVEYHEILWERQLFGIKSEMVTDATNGRLEMSRTAVQPTVATPTPAGGKLEKLVGEVKYWAADKGYGFIVARGGEEFYCAPNLLVYPEDAADLTAGTRVSFVAADAVSVGKARRATAVLVEDKFADGVLVALPTDERQYGWLEVKDALNHGQLIFVARSELAEGMAKGDTLSFKMVVTPKGAKASEIAATGEADAA